MGMLNAMMMRQQQPGFQSTGPAYPHFTQRMAETGQLSLGANAQPQPGFQGMGAPQAGASPFVSPAQQALMDSGNALNAAMQQQMQADPMAGSRLAQMLQQTLPQKRRGHTLGGGL